MSDSPTNEALRGPSRSGRKMGFLVFFLGFFAGFVAALALNSRVSHKDASVSPGMGVSEVKETVTEHQQTPGAQEAEPSLAEGHSESEATEVSSQEMVISRQTRDRLLSIDFLNLLQDAELHRFRYEGETKGLRLTKIRTGSVYEKAGFKDGDIIEQINGLAVADIEKKPKKAREQLPVADRVSFKVRRDDKIITIKIKVAGDATP